MATAAEKFRALLATGRVANLPTVWSNVLVGFWLIRIVHYYEGFPGIEETSGRHLALQAWMIFFSLLVASCLYVGGCLLGDYRDVEHDRIHRPGRPLPLGVLSPGRVVLIALLFIITGLLATFIAAPVSIISYFDATWTELKSVSLRSWLAILQYDQILLAGSLTTLVVLYSLFHKKCRILALLNMASCRLLLVLFASAMAIVIEYPEPSFHRHWLKTEVILLAACVGFYTLLLSSVAATEHNREKLPLTTALRIGILLLPLAALVMKPEEERLWYFLIAYLVYLVWTGFALGKIPGDKPAFVSRALAGFCLLDACFAATFSPLLAAACLGLFGLALLLQKTSPAT